MVDPHYWFDGTGADATVETSEGVEGMLLEETTQSKLQQLRDNLDRGQLPDKELVVRDDTFLWQKWPSIAVRIRFVEAPSIVDRYPEYQRAVRSVSKSLRFTDIKRVDEYFENPEGVPTEVKAEALNLASRDRSIQMPIPSPELVDTYPGLVGDILGIEGGVSEVSIVAQLLESFQLREALADPATIEDDHLAKWITRLDWVTDGTLTQVGEFAQDYISASAETQREFEAVAILTAAEAKVGQLVASKLGNALSESTVSIPDVVVKSELFEVLQHRANASVYQEARQQLREDSLETYLGNVEIESADVLREHVAESRARKLSGILDDLELVPVELYSADVPVELQPLVAGLDPDVLVTALDQAIADNRATLDEALENLEALIERLSPLLSPRRRERLLDLMTRVEETREGLSVTSPESPEECVALYENLISQELSREFAFSQTAERLRENILASCEDYIREQYSSWVAAGSREERSPTMIVDAPKLLENELKHHEHVIMLISDGFGLRQWLEGSQQSPRYREWEAAGAVENELATTVFPSETGAGHYSFLTGMFPMEHGRDDIQKSIAGVDDHLFDRATAAGAHTKALSYLSGEGSGFSSVLSRYADEFEELSDFRSASSALSAQSLQATASHIRSHDQTFTLIQHNQIDQIHESTEYIANALLPGVTSNLLDYIESLAEQLNQDVSLILTADHGMLRLEDEDLLNVTSYDMKRELNERGFEIEQTGQRTTGLKPTSGGHQAWGDQDTDEYEILNETTMEELKAKTQDKCNGPTLRMKRRYYSHKEPLSATHGGFTFDEMFIPMLRFDFEKIAELL